jgi:nitroreductase
MNGNQSKTASDVIGLRRSVRSYLSKSLGRETINSLLQAAVKAPTAMHQESWRFIVIQDQAILNKISQIARPLFAKILHETEHTKSYTNHDFNDPGFNIFYDADTLIVIVAKASGQFVEADCWLAAQNIMLLATQMGLGTCVIGSAVQALNTPDMKAFLKIPDGYVAIVPIIVGIPSGVTAVSSRKDPIVLSWIQ